MADAKSVGAAVVTSRQLYRRYNLSKSDVNEPCLHVVSMCQEASAVEIKKAYRRMSLMLHPDKNKEPDAETQFRQVKAADH